VKAIDRGQTAERRDTYFATAVVEKLDFETAFLKTLTIGPLRS
jgi:hypothetical protein